MPVLFLNKGDISMPQYEKFENVTMPYIFRKDIPAGQKGKVEVELTASGFVRQLIVTFATGENGTLHLRPMVIANGGIPFDLLQYAADPYINGDDTSFPIACFQEIENGAKLRIEYENTGTGTSKLSVDAIVQYNDYVTERNIIG